MEDTELEKRLDKIDDKLDKLTEYTIKTAEQEVRIHTIEKQIAEIRSNNKMWISPIISAVIAAVMAWIFSGGLSG